MHEYFLPSEIDPQPRLAVEARRADQVRGGYFLFLMIAKPLNLLGRFKEMPCTRMRGRFFTSRRSDFKLCSGFDFITDFFYKPIQFHNSQIFLGPTADCD
jgi:hypothetical protein